MVAHCEGARCDVKRDGRAGALLSTARMPALDLAADLAALASRDADVARELGRIGTPPSRARPSGFATLLRIIIGQQVSTSSAAAMWSKLEAAQGGEVTPAAILACTPDALRGHGFSRQKAAYALGLARDIAEGRLNLARLARHGDEAAMAELIKVKGVGVWTAEIYLLFALRRADVFPAGDLALQVSFQRLKRRRKRPTPEQLRKLVEPWRPYRGAAAHLLWHAYANPPLR